MSIYTKTGDEGNTFLLGGKNVKKSHPLIELLGSVDELSSFLGHALNVVADKKHKQLFIFILKDFYEIMGSLDYHKDKINNLDNRIKIFEKEIDKIEHKTGKLNRFILPCGSETAGRLHLARTVCRRTEREAVRFLEFEKELTHREKILLVIKYLNRLSDLLFMMARYYNKELEIKIKKYEK